VIVLHRFLISETLASTAGKRERGKGEEGKRGRGKNIGAFFPSSPLSLFTLPCSV